MKNTNKCKYIDVIMDQHGSVMHDVWASFSASDEHELWIFYFASHIENIHFALYNLVSFHSHEWLYTFLLIFIYINHDWRVF